MKKNKNLAYIALLVSLVLFNVVTFVIPVEKTSAFWTAYAFTTVAFLVQIGVWSVAFKKDNSPKSKILGVSTISVGLIYLVLQLVAFAIFMAIPTIENWIVILTCAILLGLSILCLIGTEYAKDKVTEVETKVQTKVFYIRSLQVDVEMIADGEKDMSVKAELIKLAEKIRFSDPMSNDALRELEEKISEKVEALKTSENKTELINELSSLITERNKKVKLLK